MTTAAPSRTTITWAAQQIVRQHREPAEPDRATGTCAQCTDAGCAMLTWAKDVLSPELARSAI
jgi:hypothetical protein